MTASLVKEALSQDPLGESSSNVPYICDIIYGGPNTGKTSVSASILNRILALDVAAQALVINSKEAAESKLPLVETLETQNGGGDDALASSERTRMKYLNDRSSFFEFWCNVHLMKFSPNYVVINSIEQFLPLIPSQEAARSIAIVLNAIEHRSPSTPLLITCTLGDGSYESATKSLRRTDAFFSRWIRNRYFIEKERTLGSYSLRDCRSLEKSGEMPKVRSFTLADTSLAWL